MKRIPETTIFIIGKVWTNSGLGHTLDTDQSLSLEQRFLDNTEQSMDNTRTRIKSGKTLDLDR